jgi:hypothetical protein
VQKLLHYSSIYLLVFVFCHYLYRYLPDNLYNFIQLKDGKIEGWKDGRMEQWNDERQDGLNYGRMEVMEGWKYDRVKGKPQNRRMEGSMNARMEVLKCGRNGTMEV